MFLIYKDITIGLEEQQVCRFCRVPPLWHGLQHCYDPFQSSWCINKTKHPQRAALGTEGLLCCCRYFIHSYCHQRTRLGLVAGRPH